MHTDDSLSDRDYVAPGLAVVTPDAAFPRMRRGTRWNHPWKYLRRDVPHHWYVDERFPLMGFLNRDEAAILYNTALQFRGKAALEIGCWLGWSTVHLSLGGVALDVIDPALTDPELLPIVEQSLAQAGVAELVRLHRGRSPEAVHELAAPNRKWSLFFIDGDHEGAAPLRDTLACRPYAAADCAFLFHDLASPHVAAALRFLADDGYQVLLYQTAQIMGIAWRGSVTPIEHTPDPEVAWQLPPHLAGLPVSGVGPSVSLQNEQLEVRRWNSFPEFATMEAQSVPSVCIVSNEIIGPFKNGGIGTAMTGLAQTLAAAGMPVTILYTGNLGPSIVGMDRWREHYAELGIELVALTAAQTRRFDGPLKACGFSAPWLVWEYLGNRHFDVVHFNDCCGEGNLALTAKRLGLAFHDSLLVVALHSPSQWVLELNRTLPHGPLLTAFHYAEELSVRCADLLWSPSRYMLGWASEHELALPEQSFLQQYAIPSLPGLPRDASTKADDDGPVRSPGSLTALQMKQSPVSSPPRGPAPLASKRELMAESRPTNAPGRARLGMTSSADGDRSARRTPRPKEIVFFGRLEERKGLQLFCAAIDLMKQELAAQGIEVVFLGKSHICGGMESLDYIASRSGEWTFPVRAVTNLGQNDALAYLTSGEKVAVMASPLDNSPCTVYEALASGVPFLASNGGGISELVHQEDRAKVLFEPSPAALQTALLEVVENGGWIARPAVPQQEIVRNWTRMHTNWRRLLPQRTFLGHVGPTRIVALVDARAESGFDATMKSLEACPAVRRICVLDDEQSTVEEMLATLADDAVLLIHAGVTVRAEPLARMVTALRCEGVDGFLPAGEIPGKGSSCTVPSLGGSAPFGLIEGVTFTGGLLVRSEALLRAAKGRPLVVESPFLGLADLCVIHGAIWPFPAAVFGHASRWKPSRPGASPARVAAYGDCPPADRYYIMANGVASLVRGSPSSGRRDVALALIDHGLGPIVRLLGWGLRKARKVKQRLRGIR